MVRISLDIQLQILISQKMSFSLLRSIRKTISGLLPAGIVSMLVMLVLGIPVYVCATASVPVAAVLIAKGLSPGAALVFLMTGPATNAAAFMTIGKVMGFRSAGIYLATVAFSAIAFGLLLDAIFPELSAQVIEHTHQMGTNYFGQVCAILLMALLIFAIATNEPKPKETSAE